MIELDNIQIQINKIQIILWKKLIISEFSLDLESWDFFWLYWCSWIWKTTILKSILWVIKPSKWQILINWKNLYWKDNINLRKIIWISFQDYLLIDEFDLYQNLIFAQNLYWISFDKNWIDFLLNKFWLKDYSKIKVSDLSWWQKERLSLIRALLKKPKILILDEPWSSLDEENKKIVYEILKEYLKSNIIICASHDEFFKNYINKQCYLG